MKTKKTETEEERNTVHETVLKKETIDYLQLKDGEILLDATLNAGGHSLEAIKRAKVKIVGIDADSDAIARARKNLPKSAKLIVSNFRNLDQALVKNEIPKINKVIFDLGISSDQLEKSDRGFSFKKDEPLIMTMQSGGEISLTAEDVVNNWGEESLVSIIKGFGEDKFARRIAKKIVEERAKKPITKTLHLAEVIKSAYPKGLQRGKINPATKTFQAIRIAVNDELGALSEGLEKAWDFLEKGGRMAVISFHSLEDRIVKHFMKSKAELRVGKILTKKPVVPSIEEVKVNKRSRSAKLRVIEKMDL